VHPTKSEVRFAREWEVHHAVRVAVRETLITAQLAPEWGLGNQAAPQPGDLASPLAPNTSFSGAPLPTPYQAQTPSTSPADYRGYHQPVAPHGGNIAGFHAAYQAQGSTALPGSTLPGSTQGAFPELAPPPAHEGKLKLRPLAQISNNAYILCEAEDGLYIVCQHRAHERILADQAIAAAEGKTAQSQRLVIPYTVEVGPRAAAALEENASLLSDLGFEIEAFGGSSVLVRAVPAAVANKDYETAFTDLLDELIAGHGGRDLQERRRQLLTMLACKNAIKAGDPLGPEQINNLIEELLLVPKPSICPHGQPILIKISKLELNKKFEREYASR
jgi:DNA mismatch repair protein MutL